MKWSNVQKLVTHLHNVAVLANPLDYIYVLKSGVCTVEQPRPEYDAFKIRAGFALQTDRLEDIALQLFRFFKTCEGKK